MPKHIFDHILIVVTGALTIIVLLAFLIFAIEMVDRKVDEYNCKVEASANDTVGKYSPISGCKLYHPYAGYVKANHFDLSNASLKALYLND